MRTCYHALVVVLVARAVAAEPAPRLAGVVGKTRDEAILVGAGGEIFGREGGVWRRRGGGGVAIELARVWGEASTAVWAVGARAPVFRHDGTSWKVVPGARGGPATLAGPGSPLPALAVGKRVYLGTGNGLRVLPQAPGRVTALLARGPGDVLAVADGALVKLAGARWRPVAVPAAEPVVELCAAGKRTVGLGSTGGLFTLERDRLRRASMEGFQPHACGAAGGRVLVSATVGAVLEIASSGMMPLPSLPAGDVIALLPFPAGGELAVTRDGRVLVRDGGDWMEETIDPAPPPPGDHPVAPPAPIPAPIPAPPASR